MSASNFHKTTSHLKSINTSNVKQLSVSKSPLPSKPKEKELQQKTPPRINSTDDNKETPKAYKCYCNPDGSVVRIREELKNDDADPFKVNLNLLMGKNKGYFEHLGGTCVCGMCICGRCKCPKKNLTMDISKSTNSEYQAKYVPLKGYENAPNLKGDFYTSQYSKTPLDFSTTNKNDYKPPGSSYGPLDKGNRYGRIPYAPFLGNSSYKNDYVGWGANPSSNLKPGYQVTVIKELPFIGRTIYKDNYQGTPGEKDEDVNKLIANAKYGTFRSPVSPEFPFMGDTTYQNTYKPFKTYKFGDGKKNKNEYEKDPIFDGQFLSTSGKDYSDKGIRKCPARDVLNKLANEGVISWSK